jgi:Lon protease-like protein
VPPADAPLPIFPLSNVVLFPRVQCPLHLFEPRYRQLAETAIAGDRRIGMVTVLPEHVSAMRGDPPIYPVGCTGLITECRKLPDGRYNIVLLGTERFRVVSELPPAGERLYRLAEVEALPELLESHDDARIAELRERVTLRVCEFVRRTQPDREEPISAQLFDGVDDITFVNALATSFAFLPQEKQQLLETDEIPLRFERLADVLSFRLAELSAPNASDPSTLH